MRKIHIVDYGLGNLFSVISAIRKIEYKPVVVNSSTEVALADFLVLPGVGAFRKGINAIATLGFKEVILEHVQKGKPILGICLGMQMLFDSSDENGFSGGLGLIPGHVKKIVDEHLGIKIPHIGWGALISVNGMLKSFIEQQFMYFVHSYTSVTDSKYCVAKTDYHGFEITSMVNKDNIWGCQFHPEKSGHQGLIVLKEILRYC